MFYPKQVVLMLFFLLILSSLALAQDSGTFDWANLGVNVTIISGIIAVVQLFKQYIPANLIVFVPIILSVAAFFLVGRGDQPIQNVIYWAGAAGYLWDIANQLTPSNMFKSKSDYVQR